ncbi:nucleotidyltransferase domain-containing protein [Streptomyces sp. NBC_01275]|uniref:nucleotidyltransferase domain-containing protein n=1 Tax=Streptomyces sp. NBC_01275 TaxID=2903807 RepID=UPI00225A5370|nr:nucleotidyltransferase domain-containing protein [Streptomyces sp. NBC_01275]MCX4760493.1 nucleotidyltransferase domain-containing protein [Streptomyces sp. NBC_01275]
MTVQGEGTASTVGVSAERQLEMRTVVDRVTRWAGNRSDAVALLLVGSWARDAARPDSDVDLVLLTTEPSRYADDDAWVRELALGEVVRIQQWGPVTEWRHVTASGLEVEVGVGSPDWARTDPVDVGTRRVVTDGARALYDPAGLVAALIRACA